MLGLFSPLVFLGRAQRKLLAHGNPILTYHKMGQPPPNCRDPFLYSSADALEQHLRRLREAGFSLASLSEFLTGAADRRTAALTFDDGFVGVLENGLEVLARHQAKAIQFIVTGFIGRRNEWDLAKGDVPEPLMDSAQIKQWLASGHEIGSHTATHRNLKQLSPAEAREEVLASKKALEDRFGVPVRHFCYPFGGYSPAVRDLVIEAGYTSASSVLFGANAADADRFALRRIIPLSSAELARKAFHRLGQRMRPTAQEGSRV